MQAIRCWNFLCIIHAETMFTMGLSLPGDLFRPENFPFDRFVHLCQMHKIATFLINVILRYRGRIHLHGTVAKGSKSHGIAVAENVICRPGILLKDKKMGPHKQERKVNAI